ncbi:methyltransferase [Saccharothrix coeruleofusca]|uniref:O-methyltransferase n=1 Tax=Saccharothrix coeruleofusca TaxID=33919 RepID=A0A918EEJ7_9PSEU|nr:methyltransferase [Saccharothrix coeruleofusca]MBP2337212.1 8-O-methyltransferase [Saccharothrix coeruleofusca]GGP66394.1 O-methyltransferase [Saccharothrix coeruleofusca]
MTTTDQKPGPAALLDLGTSFWAAKVLLTAVEIDLFSLLARGPLDAAGIAERLGLHPRAVPDFLGALRAEGLLVEQDGEYRNSAAADIYLDKAKPSYVGGFLTMVNWQYHGWGKLGDLLRTGRMQNERAADFASFYANPEVLARFMAAMDGASRAIGPALAHAVDWSEHASVVDLGGARGNLAAELAKAHPHLAAGCFDLPPIEPLFVEHMERLKLTGRVRFHGGDFFTDELPPAEAYVVGHVMHDWDAEHNRLLARRAFEALPPGGSLMVYDAMIDPERPETARNHLLSLNMQLLTAGGAEYPVRDYLSWLREAGFTDVSATPLTASDTLVRGRKPVR